MCNNFTHETATKQLLALPRSGDTSRFADPKELESTVERMISDPKPLQIKKGYINNSAVCRFLCSNKGLVDDGTKVHEVKTMPDRTHVECAKVRVEYRDVSSAAFDQMDITMWDKAVMDAVYTLCKNGYVAATTQMISKVMSGSLKQKVRQRKIDAIESSLNKLSKIFVTLDVSDEFNYRGIEMKSILSGYLFDFKLIQTVLPGNHEKVNAYLLSPSILYLYAEATNQMVNAPFAYWETSKALRDGDDSIIIRNYLIARIHVMKCNKNNMRSSHITYEWKEKETGYTKGMFADLGYMECNFSNWRNKKEKIHSAVGAILGYYKKNGLIRDFKPIKAKGYIRSKTIGYDIVV